MPITHPHEHEAKFQLAPEQYHALRSGSIALAGIAVEAKGAISQTDIYLDTPAFDLLRRGIALRVRKSGATFEAGLKSIQAKRRGAVLARADIAFPLASNVDPLNAKSWSQDVQEHLRHYSVKLRDLRPLVIVRQERQKAHLFPTGSENALAEWSLDKVWIEAAAQETTAPQEDSHRLPFHELEIEQLVDSGNAGNNQLPSESFLTLVNQVQEQFDLKPIYSSKLVRGLEIALAQSHENATSITSCMTLEAASRLLLHQQLFEIMLNEHGVRNSTKARYIHDMRVAIRRARAAMQLCQHVVPAKTLAPHLKDLRRLARALGTVRDLDVALANLRSFHRSLSGVQQRGIKRLRAELKQRRDVAHTELLKWMESKKHRTFISALTAFCTSPSVYPLETIPFEVVPHQVRHTLPSLILAAFEAVRAYESTFGSGAMPPLETFHALRIRAKYLRYLLEFSQHLLGDESRTLVSELRDLQEKLGELNDAHVEHQRLEQWAQEARHDDALLDAIHTRLSGLNARLLNLTSAIPATFASFIDYTNRQKLANALALI